MADQSNRSHQEELEMARANQRGQLVMALLTYTYRTGILIIVLAIFVVLYFMLRILGKGLEPGGVEFKVNAAVQVSITFVVTATLSAAIMVPLIIKCRKQKEQVLRLRGRCDALEQQLAIATDRSIELRRDRPWDMDS